MCQSFVFYLSPIISISATDHAFLYHSFLVYTRSACMMGHHQIMYRILYHLNIWDLHTILYLVFCRPSHLCRLHQISIACSLGHTNFETGKLNPTHNKAKAGKGLKERSSACKYLNQSVHGAPPSKKRMVQPSKMVW